MPTVKTTSTRLQRESRPIWGGKLLARVPAIVEVSPAEDDPDPLDYDVEMDLDVIGGRMVCTRLCVRQRAGGPPITSENLRRVPVGEMIAFAATKGGLVREPGGDRFEPPPVDFAKAGMTDKALHQASHVYRMASASGDRPYGVLEREFGLPRAKAARWIATARRRGILGDEEG